MNLLIINGPNLNLIGIREPSIYGNENYQSLEDFIKGLSLKHDFSYKMIQTNHEGAIIDALHQARIDQVSGIIINPGAFAHYAYAIYDAILSISIPTIEVHLSNIKKREAFRRKSVVSAACIKAFYGEHFRSYEKAILYLKGDCDEK